MSAQPLCRSCGAQHSLGARFCSSCGTPLVMDGAAAEYKQVTVLFADVVRSMDIAAALDMERLREVMTELVEGSATVIRRYGGTVEFNGDGVMALFGAPLALEDHAYRACLAALDIQDEARRLAGEVKQSDGLELRLRVGLNSGQVIAGKIGSGAFGYVAIGETVGFAQRMESVAPPGGVVLSESTARLVADRAVLSEPESARIKGSEIPVSVRHLRGMGARPRQRGRVEAAFVGRRWEMAALEAIVDRAIVGHGGVVNLIGPPGIGKSRVSREVAALASGRDVDVVWAFCESHASDVPFHVLAQLLRSGIGLTGLEPAAARARVRAAIHDGDDEEVSLLNDLLGIADPAAPPPQIDPDARRRRLTALIGSALAAGSRPTVFIVEDAHWIDAASESMLDGLLSGISTTPSMVLITARPEYEGPLARRAGSQTISLGPLVDPETASLTGQLLGPDPSVADLAVIIARRSAGNPFFAEEMVRELAQRDVLDGTPGNYVCRTDAADVAVPATVQAAIEARIDRLSQAAKKTLNAAAVIGLRFDAELLSALEITTDTDELLSAQLIDQVRATPKSEYVFHHPLIQAVAYESQLKSDRAEWHRRLASVLQDRASGISDENAVLIAEHLESAAAPDAAYDWHMRAAAWLTNRDIGAARRSWERARRLADQLPDSDESKLSKQIAPRTMLSVTDFHARAMQESRGRFAELRVLCEAAADRVSLAIGMTGLASELLYDGRGAEASRLATEQMALLNSIGDPNLTVGLGFVAFACWYNQGQFEQILEWSQTIIDLAQGDATKGAGFGFGSPLAAALAFRGVARWWLGRPGWSDDLRDAVDLGRKADPTTLAFILAWTYGVEIAHGVLKADDTVLDVIDEVAETVAKTSNDNALMLTEYSLGIALVHRDHPSERQRGVDLLLRTLEMLRERVPSLVAPTEVWVGAEQIRFGDRERALPVMRRAIEELIRTRRIGYCVATAPTLVEILLEGGSDGEIEEARQLIESLSALQAEHDSAMLEVTLMRLRALVAAAVGDPDFTALTERYHAKAVSLGFQGHLAWAQVLADRAHAPRSTSIVSSLRA
ncbi:MAG: adenylate/guanylate cyclase domain-containing protein [Mycobacterium sp.]